MMRLLGVLVGSALAVAALVVFVGIPEFTTESSVAESTVITLPMRSDPPARDPGPEAPQREMPAAASTPPPADAPAPAEAVSDIAEAAPAAAENTAAETEAPPAPRWYAFWSPFRSEIAANGFVDQLQRVTGLDYRVVKVKPGAYEVAFAYEDDQDISANLSRISAATGLQLPEG
jgi:hypothetical protein